MPKQDTKSHVHPLSSEQIIKTPTSNCKTANCLACREQRGQKRKKNVTEILKPNQQIERTHAHRNGNRRTLKTEPVTVTSKADVRDYQRLSAQLRQAN